MNLRKLFAFAIAAGSTMLAAGSAHAVGTRTFELSTIDDLSGGDLTGVAIDANGNIFAGYALGKVPVNDVQTAWSSALLADGSVLVGTGNEGKIVKVTGANATVFASTGEMAVSAMTIAWGGDAIAGTFPKGKLFRVPKAGGGKDALKPFASLEGVEYIWALAFDEKSKSLYAATGPDGKILRIDESGRAQVHFDSEDAHIVSLAVGPGGVVYAGTSGKALLYAIDAPGRAKVLFDFDADDVSAITVAKDGSVYATANKYGGSFSLPSKGGGGMATPQSPRPQKPGEGVLYKFKGATSEQLYEDKKTHFQSLALDDQGLVHIGTAAEGRVYTVDDNHMVKLVADVESRQIGALHVNGQKRYLVGSDPVAFHEIKGTGGADAVWTSKVLDAGLKATFGNLAWRGKGAVELSMRSGNTQEPDTTWSAWSNALTKPGKTQTPPGRYVQIRARFGKDATATAREIDLSFVTENARAVVTSISSESRMQKKGSLGTGIIGSGGKAPKPTSTVNLRWDVENPDKDDLRYRVWYRLEGQTVWRDALKPTDVFQATALDWDTTALPEGNYRIRVEASDELVNPPDRVTKHALESSTVLVDNTPPVFKDVRIDGRKLSGEVIDGLGPISRIEVAIAGTDDWRPLFPVDSVFDDPAEKFNTDISTIVPAGPKLIGLRAYDTAGNVVTKELEAK